MPEKVAVIVVTHNSGDDILAALWSLVSLERAPDVYILVDNASKDDALVSVEREFPAVQIIRNNENVGFSRAVNQGVERALKAQITHVWLFNPDARARSGALTELISLSRHSPKTLLSPVIFNQDGSVWFSGGSISFWRMRAIHQNSFPEKEQDFLTGCALFIPREAFECIGNLDEQFFLYYEDADYSIRARKAGFKLFVARKSFVDHFEVSQLYSSKTYFLVLSGLIFFFKHANGLKKLYIWIYVTIRRLKNRFDCFFWGGKEAMSVRRAYEHFFQSLR